MTRHILQLGVDETWRVLELIDLVDLAAAKLVERATAGDAVEQSHRLVHAPATGAPAMESVLVEDLRTGDCCRLGASMLQESRNASVAALAARKLLAPGAVTAAVFGSGSSVQQLLAIVARHVLGISAVAMFPASDGDTVLVRPAVLDLLDQVGTDLSVAAGVDEAVFGANLLLIADSGRVDLRLDQVALGALLVNVSGRDLPDRLVRDVDGIFVDDLGLLDANRHRGFVRAHLDPPDAVTRSCPEGWHRGRAMGGSRRIDADLGQVLAGTHAGRRLADDILLVELLGVRELDVALASRIQQVAQEHGIGTWLWE
jgi:ornithine cyclodeaminase/alanine dehydrogenase-like protein (mu-crystallin family)